MEVCLEESCAIIYIFTVHPFTDLFIPQSFYFTLIIITFSFFGHTEWHMRSYFPDQVSNPHPLHWQHRVLTTGHQGSPCPNHFRSQRETRAIAVERDSSPLKTEFVSIFINWVQWCMFGVTQ